LFNSKLNGRKLGFNTPLSQQQISTKYSYTISISVNSGMKNSSSYLKVI